MQTVLPLKPWNQILFSVAVLFLLLIFSNIFLVNACFVLSITPPNYIFIIAVAVTLIVSSFLLIKNFKIDWKFLLAAVVVATVTFLFSLNQSRLFIDVSWDGQAYHLEAIIKMFEGWNPVKQQLDNNAKIENIFINHYPRGGWYNSLSIFLLTGDINNTKVFNYVLFFTALAITTVTLNHFLRINFFAALFIALIAATNPVVICQSQSNYIDGSIYACILVFCSLAVMLFFSDSKAIIFLLAIIISILIDYKFTMPVYLTIFIAGGVTVFYFLKNKTAIRRIILASVFGFAIGILVNGFSPYITNTIEYDNPFYPIGDKSKPEIQNGIENSLQPASFTNMNRIEKIYQSVFSKAVWCRAPLINELKMPGTFADEERQNYTRADGEMAGFGPYFSLALLISVTLIPFLFFADRKIFFIVSITLIFILLSVFITKVGWLARYAPQFYLIGIIIPVGLMMVRKKIFFIPALICLAFYFYNNFQVYDIYFPVQKFHTGAAKGQLKSLTKRKDVIKVYFGNFESNRELFREKNINFVEVKSRTELNTVTPNNLSWLFNTGATN